MIVDIGHINGMRSGKRLAVILFHFGFKPLQSVIVDGVFEPSDFAVFPVSKISLYFHNRFRHTDYLIRRDKSQALRNGHKRLLGTGGFSLSAANQHVVTDDLVVFDNSQKSKILRIDVNTIVFGERNGGFEFSWQIDGTVDRFVNWLEFGDI